MAGRGHYSSGGCHGFAPCSLFISGAVRRKTRKRKIGLELVAEPRDFLACAVLEITAADSQKFCLDYSRIFGICKYRVGLSKRFRHFFRRYGFAAKRGERGKFSRKCGL